MDQFTGSDLLARARDLAPALDAASDEIERTQRIPEPLLTGLHQARLFRMLLPRSAGGDAVEPTLYLRIIEEIARHDGSVGWCLFTGNSSALMAAYLAPDIAGEIWGDPRAAVAWGPPNATKAHAVPGGYRIGGTWQFASGCRHATWMGAHAQVVEPDGSLRMNRFGRPHVRSFLFPAAEARLLDESWNVIGLRGTASDAYTVTNLFVSEPFTSTREDPALRREPGRLYAFTVQGLYAVGAAGVALGLARAMLDAFIALARRKTPRALGPLAGNAAVQSGVARAEAKLGAAHAYLLHTLETIWADANDTMPTPIADRVRLRLATAQAIEASIEVADHAYRAAGADAIFAGTAFERRFRDIHTLSQQTQARPAHFEAVGQAMLGPEPEEFF
jgi:alkylation response protein AidB-like acyl-CoA dehydrogenase